MDGSDTASIDQLNDSEFQAQHGEPRTKPTFAFVAVAMEPRRAPAPGQRGLLQSPASVRLATGHCRRKSGSEWERAEEGVTAAYRAGGEGLVPSRLRPAPAVVEGAPARPDRLAVGVAVALVADAVDDGALADAAAVRVPAGRDVGGLVAPAPAVPVQALVRLDVCRGRGRDLVRVGISSGILAS